MTYVYLIESTHTPKRHYVGKTTDLKERLAGHNAGRSTYTKAFRPWRLVSYHAFAAEGCATKFEDYLKSGSGRAFAAKHFW